MAKGWYAMPLRQRMRRAELKRQKYLRNPEYRLAIINRQRVRTGLDPLPSLEASGKLRLPVEAGNA